MVIYLHKRQIIDLDNRLKKDKNGLKEACHAQTFADLDIKQHCPKKNLIPWRQSSDHYCAFPLSKIKKSK